MEGYKRERIYVFYHNTWDKAAIMKSHVLKRTPQRSRGAYTLANSGESPPPGVWLSMSMPNGELPKEAPEEYGPERIVIPSQRVIELLSGPVLYQGNLRYSHNGLRYIRLLFTRGDDIDSIRWGERNGLTQLPITDNPYLCWDPFKNQWHAHIFPNTRVELFIPHDIDLTNCEWDTVKLELNLV